MCIQLQHSLKLLTDNTNYLLLQVFIDNSLENMKSSRLDESTIKQQTGQFYCLSHIVIDTAGRYQLCTHMSQHISITRPLHSFRVFLNMVFQHINSICHINMNVQMLPAIYSSDEYFKLWFTDSLCLLNTET